MNPAEATTTTTTATTTKPKIAGYNDQLPIAPLPDELKDADESTKRRYFREAKRVAIEKCRENRCGNDEVTAEMHLGPEIKEQEEDGEGWKRPPLWECTAQEFAYDFFKFHEQRGEFDYEFMWECVRDLLFLLHAFLLLFLSGLFIRRSLRVTSRGTRASLFFSLLRALTIREMFSSFSISFARRFFFWRVFSHNSKLDRLISRSGKPFDLLTFYGEVCRRGGFGENRIEAKLRFSISKIFKVMFNYFESHSYTDIANKLFDVYELFFLPYEKANEEEDVSRRSELKDGIPRVQEISHQYYYLRERKEVEQAHIAMHLRRGRKYDPNFVPMFRMSVHKSLLEENIVKEDGDEENGKKE